MDIIACGSRPSRKMGAPQLHRHGVAGPDHPGARSGAVALGLGAFRAGRAHGLAHPSARADFAHHLRHRPRADLGRADPPGPRRRYGVDPAGREALARRHPRTRHGAYRHAGSIKAANTLSGSKPVTDEQYKAKPARLSSRPFNERAAGGIAAPRRGSHLPTAGRRAFADVGRKFDDGTSEGRSRWRRGSRLLALCRRRRSRPI